MLGISKKVERVRTALHDAFVARAKNLMDEKRDRWELRAMVMLDIADVIRRVTLDEKELEQSS